jgi:hypothetical protein
MANKFANISFVSFYIIFVLQLNHDTDFFLLN